MSATTRAAESCAVTLHAKGMPAAQSVRQTSIPAIDPHRLTHVSRAHFGGLRQQVASASATVRRHFQRRITALFLREFGAAGAVQTGSRAW
jgi:hypothetical protein